jgi:tRNA-Thr(GGU) m(6)t(6)A37 methyltransferase TsaA
MVNADFAVRPIGIVRSPLTKREDAPRQGHEGAPAAWIEIVPEFADALDGLRKRDEVIILTWFHNARRDPLRVHPRGDRSAAETGVFATRSPDRPNPIGLHPVTILEIDPSRGIKVAPIEAIDGTPVVDIKPVI